jgi:glycosyltransferase involved in cell wall biosynthesis
MKVTIINRLAGILWGGGETFDLETARALRRLGHEVRFVIGRRWSRLDLSLEEFPVTYVRTPYLRWVAYQGEASRSRRVRALTSWALPIDRDMFERAALREILHGDIARATDLFQLCALPRLGAWLRERTGIKAVIAWHGPPGPEVRKWNQRCSGSFAFGDALDAVRRHADSQAENIPPGVDVDLFRPVWEGPAGGAGVDTARGRELLRARYGLDGAAVVFAFSGRMIPIKNLSFLVESFRLAAAADPRPILALLGDGPSQRDVLDQVRRAGLQSRVLAPGRLTRDDLIRHYQMSDALIVSSTYENFPMVTLEAMACGLPVIATRVGGLPQQIDDGADGVLVESGKVAELSSAIRRLAAAAEERMAMGRRGREKVVAQYHWLRTAERMVALYDRLR